MSVVANNQDTEAGRPNGGLTFFAVDWRLGLVLAWFFAPLFFGIAASIVIDQNILHSRYLSGALPAFLLLAAVGIRKLQHSRILGFVALVMVLVISVPAIDSSLRLEQRSDAREIMSTIRPQLLNGDQLFVYHPWRIHIFDYYLQGTDTSIGVIEEIKSVDRLASGRQRFWILTANLEDSESREILERATKTHRIAFSVVNTESQAYLLLRKTDVARD